MIEQLIAVYRKQGNTDPIEIFLDPLQDQYKVSKDLRIAAGKVIRAACGTLSNCMESDSVINTLLFINSRKDSDDDSADENTIEKFFRNIETFLQKEKEAKYDKTLHWLERSALHLVAIFCHDENLLNCISKEFLKSKIDNKDLHGSTPLHLAYLHENEAAIAFLKSHGAKKRLDNYGKTPNSPSCSEDTFECNYHKVCQNVMNESRSVFDAMKPMLVLPVKECEVIEKDFKKLFEMMVAEDGWLNAEIHVGGSVREKLKVGAFDEIDLQIVIRTNKSLTKHALGDQIHQYLCKRLKNVEWKNISLRPTCVAIPWRFQWEKEGCYHGLEISVDIATIVVRTTGLNKPDSLKYVLQNAPHHESLQFGKWSDDCRVTTFETTMCRHEWDILDNLPASCRLGIVIAKALVEALEKTEDNKRSEFLKKPISSYLIKNTLFWIISNDMRCGGIRDKEEIVERRKRDVFLQPKLFFKSTNPTWTKEDDLLAFAKEGRSWAELIFDVILHMAENHSAKLDCFVNSKGHTSMKAHEEYDVVAACERCLEQLRPDVSFSQKKQQICLVRCPSNKSAVIEELRDPSRAKHDMAEENEKLKIINGLLKDENDKLQLEVRALRGELRSICKVHMELIEEKQQLKGVYRELKLPSRREKGNKRKMIDGGYSEDTSLIKVQRCCIL